MSKIEQLTDKLFSNVFLYKTYCEIIKKAIK